MKYVYTLQVRLRSNTSERDWMDSVTPPLRKKSEAIGKAKALHLVLGNSYRVQRRAKGSRKRITIFVISLRD